MIGVTYRDGVAIVSDRARTTEVHVSIAADLIHQGEDIEVVKADVLALAAGYRALEAERDALREELAAARAGEIGKEHATDMQNARVTISKLSGAVDRFLEIYDTGNAPDSVQESELRDALSDAGSWLLHDVNAARVRAKLLKGGTP
ncbi:hypothetical protein SAMN05428966_10268 [Massilia sp. PDC64]|nr:hypothetical protein [Massilia sp. PDC64]SDC66512.1 hypothetical protein SAMN05428966_10268 [Massilia sp. PDC64]